MIPHEVRGLLDRYPASEQPRSSPTPLGAAGGLSGSRLWRYNSPTGDRLIRAWPSATDLERVVRIHGWLRGLTDLPFVPQPIASRSGATVVQIGDHCWEITPWLPGLPASVEPPDLARVSRVFATLAQVHIRLADVETRHGQSPGLKARCDEVRTLIDGGFDAIGDALARNLADPLAASATAWLDLARQAAPGVLATAFPFVDRRFVLHPCLRDARPEHFLLSGDQLTGLVDYGAMDVETASADLARLRGEWLPREGPALRAEGLETYRRIRPLDSAEVEVMDAFESLADLLIGERWVRWRYLDRRRFEDQRAHAEGLGRGLARLRRLVERLERPG